MRLTFEAQPCPWRTAEYALQFCQAFASRSFSFVLSVRRPCRSCFLRMLPPAFAAAGSSMDHRVGGRRTPPLRTSYARGDDLLSYVTVAWPVKLRMLRRIARTMMFVPRGETGEGDHAKDMERACDATRGLSAAEDSSQPTPLHRANARFPLRRYAGRDESDRIRRRRELEPVCAQHRLF